MRPPKILALVSSIDLGFRYGCTPAWWQLWKGLHEEGVDLILAPYRGRPIESPWWRIAENPTYREGESFAFARDTVARLKGDTHLRRAEDNPEDGLGDRMTREVIWRWVTPRWRKHLERLVERERPDAVVVFTVPMAHLRGIPTALRERYGIPVVFYDGDVPMSLPEFGGMDTGFNWYHDADPVEYDLLVANSEGGLERLRELGARRAEAVFWGADPDFFAPHDVDKEMDVFFYGYGDKFRREWMQAMVGEPSRLLPDVDFALGGRDFHGDIGDARLFGDVPTAFARAISAARINLCITRRSHATVYASSSCRPFELASARRRDRREPVRRDRALVRAGLRAARRRRRPTRRSTPTASCSPTRAGGGDGAPRARARARRAHLPPSRAPAARADRAAGGSACRLTPRRIAIVPAYNEERNIGRVIDELRALDPGLDVVVVSDGSVDRTAEVARDARRARCCELPFNLGIGGAVQTGFQYARENGYELAVRCDGDGQHDPAELPKVLAPGRRRRGRHRGRLALRRERAATARPRRGASASACSRSSSRRSRASASPTRPPGSRRSTARRSSSSPPTIRTTTPRSRGW